jgi:hypothetical protein
VPIIVYLVEAGVPFCVVVLGVVIFISIATSWGNSRRSLMEADAARQAAWKSSPDGKRHAAEEKATRSRSKADARLGVALPELEAQEAFLRQRAQRVREGLQEQHDAGAIDGTELSARVESVRNKLDVDLSRIQAQAEPIRQALRLEFEEIDRRLQAELADIGGGAAQTSSAQSKSTPVVPFCRVEWEDGTQAGRANVSWDGESLRGGMGQVVDWRFLQAQDEAGRVTWFNDDAKVWFDRSLIPFLLARTK